MLFGDYAIEPSVLVPKLNTRATQIARQLDTQERNTAFTKGVKLALDEIGRGLGFRPIYTDRENKKSEFMLDMVWWQEDESGASAVLGAELEWGNPRDRHCDSRANCVADDFEKLLQFKAPIKLMVFTADNEEMRSAVHEILQRYMRRFRQHVAGELYVFVEFSAGQCFGHVCRISHDGLDASLSLTALTIGSESVRRSA